MSRSSARGPQSQSLDPSQRPITLTAAGFSFCRSQGEISETRWNQVVEIAAWKEDLFAYDVICLGFRMGAGDGAWVQVEEEQPGFMDLAEAMRKQFPSISADWYSDVMVPAFERRFTVLFVREGVGSQGSRP